MTYFYITHFFLSNLEVLSNFNFSFESGYHGNAGHKLKFNQC